MLYIHGGLPRTSTTSLQAALAARESQLRAAGVVYPTMWRPAHAPIHHEFHEFFLAMRRSTRPLDEFVSFLSAHTDHDVLISGEGLTAMLPPGESQEALRQMLTAARSVVPTRWVWTLRRQDEVLTSLYLRKMVLQERLPSPADFFSGSMEASAIFAGMRMTRLS